MFHNTRILLRVEIVSGRDHFYFSTDLLKTFSQFYNIAAVEFFIKEFKAIFKISTVVV